MPSWAAPPNGSMGCENLVARMEPSRLRWRNPGQCMLQRKTAPDCAVARKDALRLHPGYKGYDATTRGAGCQSRPVAALVGKISDLITTGTAPEFGSMTPMSM